MKNYYERNIEGKDEREIDTADFLKETGGQTLEEYQTKLERQAENLRIEEDAERRHVQDDEPDLQRTAEVDMYEQPRKEREFSGREQDGQDPERYSRGYYDGYADAMDEINMRMAEEDEYDFGRHYSGKDSRKPLPPKRRVIYEDDPRDGAVVRRRKKRRKHPFLIFLLILIVIILAVVGFLSWNLLSKANYVDSVADTSADAHAEAMGIPLTKTANVKNILLIGSDKRETDGERQRADTMIICSLNTSKRQISLVSLMRDMYVPIPDYGSNKLNAAYAIGGMELLDKTVQEDFRVDINGNIEVDFDSFLEALTSVGNLDIELTADEAAYMNSGGWEDQGAAGGNDGTWNLHEGVNSLTPAQSLAYCRIRYVGNSDWERTERQRKVIMTAFEKFKHSDPLTMYKVLSGVLSNITTDMSKLSFLDAMFKTLICATGEMKTYLIPVEGSYYPDNIDGMDVLVPDLNTNAAYLKENLYG
ncbi:MAG: LCP family protein [Eubacterium sp.]|nr:LCP family protein [Eubacterium sp.]